ncbi:hypothetical protein CYR75_07080 [Paracoccus jeotgali]|uniref:DUF192 domain-containing protein n=1 Tax=Paracoccus jeotgali TaxID=2065379 RepID=A0A2K9MJE1_9RHOB|nr:hypothetical protein CYR75_07080 [Paracoccus jeotgali]
MRRPSSASTPLRALPILLLSALTPLAATVPAVAEHETRTRPACDASLALFPEIDISITVEIADTPETRAQGLMMRPSLAPRTGMLFIYEAPGPMSFWMKNTLIPLDMIFIDASGVIRHIHENAIPGDLTPIPGATPDDADPARLMVLELAGGEARRLGLKPGLALSHPRLDPEIAARPCQ